MNNLNALRDEVFQINKENGWHEGERTYGELIALVHSEVSEALEDYRNGKAVNEVWYEYKSKDFRPTSSTNDDKFTCEYASRLSEYSGKEILGKPCGIPSELADIVIRILDICGLYGWDIEVKHYRKVNIYPQKFLAHLASIHKSLSDSYNDDKDTFTDPVITYLDVAIQEVEFICQQAHIDLESIIHQKLEYNKTRGYKHGGKVI